MYELHRLGWNSFQQLCLTIVREILGQTVQSFLDSNDGGRDGAFTGTWTPALGQALKGAFVIQCKFTSKPNALLSKEDIADELPKVRKLAEKGLCDVYVLMTNAGVSGVQETKIADELKSAGAKTVLVLGGTWITDQIRDNIRLRMLVPRVYGLGDLGQILDERAYAQARAVLDSLREDLAKVVMTSAYRKAVDALDEHGFVLLIGEPAAGKTTIASMLAMASADKWRSSVLKLSDPADVVKHWNPNEPSQFFWIDDAFGVMQYESPLVHGWNHNVLHVKSMLRKDAKVVMTSRDYIYNRARQDLKESAFPLLSESRVVIDVHDLSVPERQQILYNHLKLGSQPNEFLAKIKPHLDQVAAHARFIPETARRLADPMFTQGLYPSEYFLKGFVEKREQLLLEVIQGLDEHSLAALGLIYMRKDHLESPFTLVGSEPQALERLGSTLGDCIRALNALNGSLVTRVHLNDQPVWRFKHPTVGDAFATTLAFSPELLEIFLTGSSVESLTSQITCGNLGIEKAVVVPRSHFPMIVARLLEYKTNENYKIYSAWFAWRVLARFLATRCSKEFLVLYLDQEPTLLERVVDPGLRLYISPEVDLAARLHEYEVLPEAFRKRFVEKISAYAIDGEDLYALRDNKIRSMFSGDEFAILRQQVREQLLPRFAEVREEAQSSHDASESPEEHLDGILESLTTLEDQFGADDDAMKIISREKQAASQWIAATEPPKPRMSPRTLGTVVGQEVKHGTRSIFDDVDD
jgi:hypothetical protein